MEYRAINDNLLLVYDEESGKPLGTGFIVNEFGHFITSYHVVKDCPSIKDSIRCELNGEIYTVRYIQSLTENGFYRAIKNSVFTIDLIILELVSPNKTFEANHLPVLSFDMNEQLNKPIEVSFTGFDCENAINKKDVKLSPITAVLTEYQEKCGLWLFPAKGTIWKGYSGSPVFHPLLKEVMGVVVRRSTDNQEIGAVQSLHVLADRLKNYDYDCERFFRSPFSFYSAYHKKKCQSFEKEKWPYAIDRKEFVDAFDFEVGRFPLKGKWGIAQPDKYVVPFVIDQLKEHSVFCVGYYGMGKSTISKFLFSDYRHYSHTEYPIFISLANERLSELTLDNWDRFVAKKMYQDLIRTAKDKKKAKLEGNLAIEYFIGFVNNYRVLLILDGIDESLYNDSSLKRLPDVLESLPCSYLLTSRKEFYAFFDTFNDQMNNQEHLVIELMFWGQKQWARYIENLRKKYPSKSGQINEIELALERKEYKELPERPLFLKMISDLHLDNETNLEIELPQELRKNRAAVYHAYVRWKIKKDSMRDPRKKIPGFDLGVFTKECLYLFEVLAQIEYERSVPKNGALGYIEQSTDQMEMSAFSGFTLEEVMNACMKFHLLNAKFVKRNLFGPTFFTIIRREDDTLFRFSHKSFCEYLVGFSLARRIFEGSPEKAECGLAWNFYQTHEVSTHFQDEVRRLCYRIPEQTKKEYLHTAFQKVFSELNDYLNYSERLEQALYYTGKFELNSPKILDVLKRIAVAPSKVHPVYYRTAHLSLSMAISVDYSMKYVEYLIESYHGNKEAFLLNSKIQIGYYGKANLHSVLSKDIDEFVDKGQLKGIIPLEVFSYFTCLPFDATEVTHSEEYLVKINKICAERGHVRMTKIMDETLPIMESISKIG